MANGNLKASEIGLGCMRIANLEKNTVNNLINTALDCGINFFDHADIYGKGKSEEIFSAVSYTHLVLLPFHQTHQYGKMPVLFFFLQH